MRTAQYLQHKGKGSAERTAISFLLEAVACGSTLTTDPAKDSHHRSAVQCLRFQW